MPSGIVLRRRPLESPSLKWVCSEPIQGLTEMDPAVLVVDDNDHVWQNHRHNLLRVERYMYFPSSMRHFGRSEKSLLERGRLESPAGPMPQASCTFMAAQGLQGSAGLQWFSEQVGAIYVLPQHHAPLRAL